eukprot:10036535-Karenia_brevis.AAC.1
MLHDMNETCTQEQIAAFEAALNLVPMILGDGQKVGSLVQNITVRSAMRCQPPMDDGSSSRRQLAVSYGYLQFVGAFSQPAAVLFALA